MNFDNVLWYVKCSLPIVIGGITYKLINQSYKRKQKSALKGKVVVITGASSGIGESLAHVFYEQGCKVVLAARRGTELNIVKNELIGKKMDITTSEPMVLQLDLAEFDQVEPFVQKIYDKYNKIDILINNGGVAYQRSILKTKFEVERRIMNVNYFGTVALTKAILPKMVERKEGHIVLVSSIMGLISLPDRSAYAASKHALQAFGDALRAEMHQYNIDVTLVSPGYIKSDITAKSIMENGVMDSSETREFSSEHCAKEILDAVLDKKKEVIVSQFFINVALFFRYTIPSVYFWLMTRKVNKTE